MIQIVFEQIAEKYLRATYWNDKSEIFAIVEPAASPDCARGFVIREIEDLRGGEIEIEAPWPFDIGRAKLPVSMIRKCLTAGKDTA